MRGLLTRRSALTGTAAVGVGLGVGLGRADAASAAGHPRRGTIRTGTAWSAALGEDVRYRVYLPPGYRHGRQRCASVYLLHGRGDDLDAWTRVAGDLDTMIAEERIPPVVAVMPDAPWSEGGSYYVDSAFTGTPHGRPVETALCRDLVTHVDATYRTVVDRAHRFVGGYSMGGAGALRYLLAHDELFAGGLVLSPAVYTPLPPLDSSAREFGAFGRGDVAFVDEVYRRLGYPALMSRRTESDPAVRLYLCVGDDEWANPAPADWSHDLDLETAVVWNRAKRTPGVTGQWRVRDGGHDWDVWAPAFRSGLPFVMGAAT